MSEPFIGEIKIFAGNFAPRGWSFCNGQLLPISQNTALFSLLGTIYGGDGRTTFGLPDLQGRAPVHIGQGPGLSNIRIGQVGGAETVTLTQIEMPAHSHTITASAARATSRSPSNRLLARAEEKTYSSSPPSDTDTTMGNVMALSGGSLNHNNMMPYQAIHYIIALVGIFPSRN